MDGLEVPQEQAEKLRWRNPIQAREEQIPATTKGASFLPPSWLCEVMWVMGLNEIKLCGARWSSAQDTPSLALMDKHPPGEPSQSSSPLSLAQLHDAHLGLPKEVTSLW